MTGRRREAARSPASRPHPDPAAWAAAAAPVQRPAGRPGPGVGRRLARPHRAEHPETQVDELAGSAGPTSATTAGRPSARRRPPAGSVTVRPARRPARSVRTTRPGRPPAGAGATGSGSITRRASAAAPMPNRSQCAGGDRTEQLAGHAPPGLLLEGSGPGPQHPKARAVGGVRGGAQQARLADAGRSLDDDDLAAPARICWSCRSSAASSVLRCSRLRRMRPV